MIDLPLKEFLESLPEDGSGRTIARGEYDIAQRAATAGDAFITSGFWPNMLVRITFEGRKTLSHLRSACTIQ